MSFVAGVRRSWRPSVFIQFALDSFYADCPHKRIFYYNEGIHGKEEHATWINKIQLKYSIYSGFLCRTDAVNASHSRVYAWIVVTA